MKIQAMDDRASSTLIKKIDEWLRKVKSGLSAKSVVDLYRIEASQKSQDPFKTLRKKARSKFRVNDGESVIVAFRRDGQYHDGVLEVVLFTDDAITGHITVPANGLSFNWNKAFVHFRTTVSREPELVVTSGFGQRQFEQAAKTVSRVMERKDLSPGEIDFEIIKALVRIKPIKVAYERAALFMIGKLRQRPDNYNEWRAEVKADMDDVWSELEAMSRDWDADADEYASAERYAKGIRESKQKTSEVQRSLKSGIYKEAIISLEHKTWSKIGAVLCLNEDAVFFLEDSKGRVIDFEQRRGEFDEFKQRVAEELGLKQAVTVIEALKAKSN